MGKKYEDWLKLCEATDYKKIESAPGPDGDNNYNMKFDSEGGDKDHTKGLQEVELMLKDIPATFRGFCLKPLNETYFTGVCAQMNSSVAQVENILKSWTSPFYQGDPSLQSHFKSKDDVVGFLTLVEWAKKVSPQDFLEVKLGNTIEAVFENLLQDDKEHVLDLLKRVHGSNKLWDHLQVTKEQNWRGKENAIFVMRPRSTSIQMNQVLEDFKNARKQEDEKKAEAEKKKVAKEEKEKKAKD